MYPSATGGETRSCVLDGIFIPCRPRIAAPKLKWSVRCQTGLCVCRASGCLSPGGGSNERDDVGCGVGNGPAGNRVRPAMSRPNLFGYATSELSQDAILCWLLAWADPKNAAADPGLHDLGARFIAKIMELHGHRMPEISSLAIHRQYRSIDILVVINSRIAICIEDKAGGLEHSGQLARYLKLLVEEGYPRENIIPVYVQTFEQGSYQAVHDAGYAVLSRKDLLALLRDQAGIETNAIVRDFHDHLSLVDGEVDAFNHQPVAVWSALAWQGFYRQLQLQLQDGRWRYVANPSGGFQAFWWHAKDGPGGRAYLQLEQDRLCFKIWVEEPTERVRLRNDWHARMVQQGHQHGLDVVRPKKFGYGTAMTVAIFDGDYRVTGPDGCLDMVPTLARLRMAGYILTAASLSFAAAAT